MHLQLWSYNYDPEPTGIGPVSATLARAMRDRSHDLEVLAAHPHYPAPLWGTRLRPYRERRDGIPVRRLPIWAGRGSARQRLRQELSFVSSLSAYLPFAPSCEALVAVSPSFPALAPAMAYARLRRVPWTLWLQDILPEGAVTSGLVGEGAMTEAARRLELAAYRSAEQIVVISDSFRHNLVGKGVPEEKVTRIYNPASRPVRTQPRPAEAVNDRAVLAMGNIGRTQNLSAVVRSFEAQPVLAASAATLTITGEGVAKPEVEKAISSDRVRLVGIVNDERLEQLLGSTAIGLVTQANPRGAVDFNVPSKLMNFMAYGVPVVAAVDEESEVARLIERSGAGWVVPGPEECAATLAAVLPDSDERARRGAAGLAFAQRELTPAKAAERFEAVLVRGP